jgi:septal ring factor EnvC (AmiA/AmiB activator)
MRRLVLFILVLAFCLPSYSYGVELTEAELRELIQILIILQTELPKLKDSIEISETALEKLETDLTAQAEALTESRKQLSDLEASFQNYKQEQETKMTALKIVTITVVGLFALDKTIDLINLIKNK